MAFYAPPGLKLVEFALRFHREPAFVRRGSQCYLVSYFGNDQLLGDGVFADDTEIGSPTWERESPPLDLVTCQTQHHARVRPAFERRGLSQAGGTIFSPEPRIRFRLHREPAFRRRGSKCYPASYLGIDQLLGNEVFADDTE